LNIRKLAAAACIDEAAAAAAQGHSAATVELWDISHVAEACRNTEDSRKACHAELQFPVQ
jgi:hypothetical protein